MATHRIIRYNIEVHKNYPDVQIKKDEVNLTTLPEINYPAKRVHLEHERSNSDNTDDLRVSHLIALSW